MHRGDKPKPAGNRQKSNPRPGKARIGGIIAVAIAAAISFWSPVGAQAHGYEFGNLTIGHVWAPPPEKGAAGVAVYGPIFNHGSSTIRLVGASTPVAEQVRFRVEKNGEETWLDLIEIRPSKVVALAAWREHIWLSGLKKPLKEGDSFDLTLDFGDKGELTIEVEVEAIPTH
jgi:copper(I)-binding protein